MRRGVIQKLLSHSIWFGGRKRVHRLAKRVDAVITHRLVLSEDLCLRRAMYYLEFSYFRLQLPLELEEVGIYEYISEVD